MPTIKLEVVSPDAMVYQADISMLIVRSIDGELGILPHHAPMIAGLLPCAMRVKLEDHEELIAVAGGFMEVQPDKITVLASAAETAIQIDPIRAQKAYDRARKRIEEFNSAPSKHQDIDMNRAHLALERAAARLKAVSGKR
ncbi:MAG: F0F1 ATP synthase subunit epsilon [Schwartzia sp.]|nr:F0F1 ATP synthase subunit epsilon [Schwartzia sp. (in: firmicutes)]